jgi:anthranilate synthase/aminodeoxychorismate synthase-like glutamine amidotransferase
MFILIIDNYDSFTYNLMQYFGELGAKLKVTRNDKIRLEEIERINPDKIVISPGPGTPDDAGISKEVIRSFGHKKWILGVCLGHQCIGEVFGSKIERAKTVVHGKTSLIYHNGKGIYRGIRNPFVAARYHSLIIAKDSLPPCLEVAARTEDGTIMGIRHKELSLEGVQFHPESFLTGEGKKLLKNFINL